MSFEKPTSLSLGKPSHDDVKNKKERDFQRKLRLAILTLNEVRAHYGLKSIGDKGRSIYKGYKEYERQTSINEARSVLGLLSLANPEANLKGCPRKRTFIVGSNTRHARALWQDLKKKFPQYKYPQFVSMNRAMLDGVNPSETILILLPGYYRNPIIHCYEFQWLKENAIEVIHINEEEIK